MNNLTLGIENDERNAAFGGLRNRNAVSESESSVRIWGWIRERRDRRSDFGGILVGCCCKTATVDSCLMSPAEV